MEKQQTISTRAFISLLLDASDMVAKVRREMDGMIASYRPLDQEQHETIKTLLLGIQSDAGMADSVRFERYERADKKMFAVR